MMGKCYAELDNLKESLNEFYKARDVETSVIIKDNITKIEQQIFDKQVNETLQASNNFFQKKNYNEALKMLNSIDFVKIFDHKLKAKILRNKARNLFGLKKYNEALKKCQEGLTICGEDTTDSFEVCQFN